MNLYNCNIYFICRVLLSNLIQFILRQLTEHDPTQFSEKTPMPPQANIRHQIWTYTNTYNLLKSYHEKGAGDVNLLLDDKWNYLLFTWRLIDVELRRHSIIELTITYEFKVLLILKRF